MSLRGMKGLEKSARISSPIRVPIYFLQGCERQTNARNMSDRLLPFSWYERFPDPKLADAILDRLKNDLAPLWARLVNGKTGRLSQDSLSQRPCPVSVGLIRGGLAMTGHWTGDPLMSRQMTYWEKWFPSRLPGIETSPAERSKKVCGESPSFDESGLRWAARDTTGDPC